MPSAEQELHVLDSRPSELYTRSKHLAKYVVNKALGRRQKCDKIGEKLYELCIEMKNDRASFFDNICVRLNLNRDNIEELAKSVMIDVFVDGCNFGRIVALFTFCLKLCQFCDKTEGLQDQIDMIIEITTSVICKQRNWFEREGSWVSLISYF